MNNKKTAPIHPNNLLLITTLFVLCMTPGMYGACEKVRSAGEIGTKFSAQDYDLVEIIRLDPTIVLDIRYATANNFAGQQVYPSCRCFLRRAAAERLCMIQRELREQGIGLKVFDGYRPFSVQEIFWSIFPVLGYVAQPIRAADGSMVSGSKHNRGAAVDLTLIDLTTGQELEMPSGYDDLSKKAHRNYAAMTPVAAQNCRLLENVMAKYGFEPLPTEWWHFDLAGWRAFELLDVPFDEIG